MEAFRTLPLIFEQNAGQTDPSVTFLSRGNGYTLFVTSTEAVLVLRTPSDYTRLGRSEPTASGEAEASVPTVLRMKLVGANPRPRMVGLEELPGKVNYFIGNDPTRWRTNIPTYAKAKYESVYPGVDLVYYGSDRQLEYDFVVAPGANPDAITLAYEGPDNLEVDSQGDLVIRTAGGEFRLRRPLVYQVLDGIRKPIGRNVLWEYQTTGNISHKPNHPTNTCDPCTGNWDKHLMDTHHIKAIFQKEGFEVQIRSDYYALSQRPLKQLIRYVLNSMIGLLETKGIILTPSYMVYALGGPAQPTERRPNAY